MKTLIAILLLTLVSCGSESEQDQVTTSNCEVNADIFNRTWDQESTGNRYDITVCAEGIECRVCASGACNSDSDIDLTYYANGTLTIDYFNLDNELTARWKICDGDTLRMYNFSDGSGTEIFTAIN